MKKGLYITYFYLPVLVPRSIVSFKHLENSSFKFDVYCKKGIKRESDQTLKHVKNKVNIYNDNYDCDRWYSRFLWVVKTYKFFIKNKHKYDYIVTSFQPIYALLAGLFIKMFFPKVKWISYYSDPPGNVLIQKNNNNYIKTLFLYIEGWAANISYKYADLLLFTNKYQLNYCLKTKQQYTNKAIVLYHSYMKELYPAPYNNKNKQKVIISYFGHMYNNRNAMNMLKALNNLKKKRYKGYHKLEFNFYGEITNEMKNYIEQNKLSNNIRIISFIDYKASLKKMVQSDYLLNIDAFLGEKNVYFASKLADYLGANIPIISLTPDGITKDIMKKTGHIFINDSVNNIEKLLQNILDTKIRININKNEVEKFSANYICKQLDEAILKLLNERN